MNKLLGISVFAAIALTLAIDGCGKQGGSKEFGPNNYTCTLPDGEIEKFIIGTDKPTDKDMAQAYDLMVAFNKACREQKLGQYNEEYVKARNETGKCVNSSYDMDVQASKKKYADCVKPHNELIDNLKAKWKEEAGVK